MHTRPGSGLSLGDRRGRGAGSGRWLAGAVAGGCILLSAGAAGCGAGVAVVGKEDEPPAGAADVGEGGRGPRRPEGKYPNGGRGASGAGTGSGRSVAGNFAGLA